MQLLSKQTIDAKKQKLLDEYVMREGKLSAAITTKTKEYNKLVTDLLAKQNQMELDFARFSENLSRKRDSLLQEVAVLEERKREALKPFKELQETLLTKERELIAKEQEVMFKEAIVASGASLVAEEKAQLALEKEKVKNSQKTLKNREVKLKAEQENLESSQAKLSRQQEQFEKKQRNELKKLANKIEEERVLLSKNKKERLLLDERIAYLKNKEREIEDRYFTLQRSERELSNRK